MCHLEHAGISDQGRVRYRNEDFIAHEVPTDSEVRRRQGCLFVVADGVGGSGAGNVASREATEALVRAYYESRRPPERALRDAFARANMHVYDLGLRGGKFRMETTMVALALVGDCAFIAHVGDSRLYRVRHAGHAEPLTRDHSEVAELVRMQILTPENARHHPRRHIITRSVGSDPVLRVAQRVEPLQAGDAFVLCTDGLWEPVSDPEIASAVAGNSAEEACRRLTELGLARQSNDNLSVQVIKVLQVNKENAMATANNLSWWRRLFVKAGQRPDEDS
ncbi:MAG: serine/threonine-protein phosphatase [Armatimonadetes bacterium]|nr:serine/threonine-protein phosphatase [Armatimonadota bacterium]